MTGQLVVHNPGLLSLVQDSGRSGYQRYGVSVSGAMDQEALMIANLLVGNETGAAAIEVTFGGAEFEFLDDLVVAVTGADLQPTLDGTPLSTWESFTAPANSVLRLPGPLSGLRAYVSVGGGIDTPWVLGSRSTHVSSGLGGNDGSALKSGDTLQLGEATSSASPAAQFPGHLRHEYGSELIVRVVSGPQSDQFSETGRRTFYSSPYTVTESSDRQGLRLEGPQVESAEGRYDIVSDAVVFGSVQVPGDGKPIVLLADRQTTGGYAKIGVVATVDLPLLAQAPPGTVIRFTEIDVAQAQTMMRDRLGKIMNADLSARLHNLHQVLTVNDRDLDLGITFRPEDLSRPGGCVVSVQSNGTRGTVRVQEIE